MCKRLLFPPIPLTPETTILILIYTLTISFYMARLEHNIEGANDEVLIDSFRDSIIEELKTLPGVGEATAEKIFDGGYYSIMDVAVASVGSFTESTAITDATAIKIISGARKMVDLGDSRTALEMLEEDKNIPKLSTGVKELDMAMQGGLTPGLITQIYAEGGLGKTQWAKTIATIATRPVEEGGLDTDVLYIDTEGTFRPNRVKQIAEARGFDVGKTLSRIHTWTARTTAEQILLVQDEIKKKSAELGGCKLVIIDSLMTRFRGEFTGRGKLGERQNLINKHMFDLLSFARANNAVILVTVPVSANPDAFFGNMAMPTGGNIVKHNSAYVLNIRRAKQGKVVLRVEKAPDLPMTEVLGQVKDSGMSDA